MNKAYMGDYFSYPFILSFTFINVFSFICSSFIFRENDGPDLVTK